MTMNCMKTDCTESQGERDNLGVQLALSDEQLRKLHLGSLVRSAMAFYIQGFRGGKDIDRLYTKLKSSTKKTPNTWSH